MKFESIIINHKDSREVQIGYINNIKNNYWSETLK